ncbi:hypothetical protein N8455_00060 [Candidatus Gracilibacteria bacterium]|jgi:hypothetical protein|nr:hypothetical protein [Candidatus Gracilibacteria bacterium]
MARQTINTGTVANDNTGDTMRNAGTKINANFSEIYTILGGDSVTPTTTMSFGTNTIVAEGSVADDHETTLAFTNPTADRTITFPDETGTVQLTGGSQSLTSAVLTTPQIQDTSSNHKYIFASSELDSDTTVNLPLLTDSDTFSFVGFTETLLNKTLTSPVLTTPKFADAGFIADANGNEAIVFQTATGAVNHVELTNAATGAAPAFNAVGGDTNVTMSLAAKGTGSLNLNSKINYTTETLTGTTVAASAVIPVTVHNASSAIAASLINGTVAGQIKKFVNIGAGIVTLTPATYAQGTTIVLAQHDNAELLWTGSTWYDLGQQTLRDGATLKIGAQTSGLATTIGHATSEVTVGDNLTVTGNLTVSGTTTTVNTQTINAANALVFEGATADDHETTLTVVDPTADRTINIPNQSGTLPLLAAVSTTAITSTPEELNILDGATVVVGEINALDLGATAVGTAIASKAVILDANKDYTGIRNLTATGQVIGVGFTGTLDGVLGSGAAAAATVTTLNTSGAVNLNLVTDSTSSTSGALIVDGGVGIAKKLFVGTDLDVDGTANLDIVDIDGAVNMATTALVTGVLTTTATQVATGGITSGSNIVSDTDSTDDLGTTSVRWANLFVDAITATDQITATGFTGTLDGILGSGAAAAASVTTLGASGLVTAAAKIDMNGTEIILDADADTSITADTDDQIDIRIAGADDFKFTANTFTALAGSSIVIPASGLTIGSTAMTSTAAELNLLDNVSGLVQADFTKLAAVDATAAELNILDASAGNTAVASDVASSAGAITSNNAKISHTITLNANLADDAIHADIVVTNDKVLATSVVMASASIAVGLNIHTVIAGSFKVSITNLTGAQMDDDSTLIVNYRVI